VTIWFRGFLLCFFLYTILLNQNYKHAKPLCFHVKSIEITILLFNSKVNYFFNFDMSKTYLTFIAVLILSSISYGQSYTSYYTGNSSDIVTAPSGGSCLMGGASENDSAMNWFLENANGGDILVLRASGSDGYNNYLYSGLNASINSVETIVFNNNSAANETYIHQKIQQAEGIWFAGGDQWDYISYWRNTPIDSLINEAITNRNIVIGGTSAGMAILGGYYFSAENGTVTSTTALSNPFDFDVTVDSAPFISSNYLSDVITDTHYDNPDRKGRQVVFLSRILVDFGIRAKGIACDEYTAVCIDSNGMAKVFGSYPTYDDNAYFIQTNCEVTNITPEDCSPNNPLDWNLGNASIKVYAVKGTETGVNTFDLNDWETGVGGIWEDWYVDNGVLNELSGFEPNCQSVSIPKIANDAIMNIYPNPANDFINIQFNQSFQSIGVIKIRNLLGTLVGEKKGELVHKVELDISDLTSGVYTIEVITEDNLIIKKKLIIN
jgi:cyanophycinase-like exopeptidase